jgi:hypothetical protein
MYLRVEMPPSRRLVLVASMAGLTLSVTPHLLRGDEIGGQRSTSTTVSGSTSGTRAHQSAGHARLQLPHRSPTFTVPKAASGAVVVPGDVSVDAQVMYIPSGVLVLPQPRTRPSPHCSAVPRGQVNFGSTTSDTSSCVRDRRVRRRGVTWALLC